MDRAALKRFFSNESTHSERVQVIAWLLNPANDFLVKSWMRENWDFINSLDQVTHATDPDTTKIWLNIREKINEEARIAPYLPPPVTAATFPLRRRILQFAAAAMITIVAGVLYLYLSQTNRAYRQLAKTEKTIRSKGNDVAPPSDNRAVLTLADGTKVYLDSAGNGTLATQGGVKVVKQAGGEIVYSGSPSDVVAYNTLSVPKGSKPVRLVLADGSFVWLNAASSVTYPTFFINNFRKVDITGEAYFEVTKNTAKPFHVGHNGIDIKVLGTHFNVNTYGDEKEVKVTLLEGAVNVTKGSRGMVLKPGQQALLSDDNIKVLNAVDIDEVMAWKNERFYFNGADIKTIMRQIEKYYNVEIEYRDEIRYRFVAKIDRQVNVSEFLKILELTNLVHFKISDNTITVMK